MTGIVTYPLLDQFLGLVHFTTTRHGGVSSGNYTSFNLSFYSGDDTGSVCENRALLCRDLDFMPEHLVVPFQTHGIQIKKIDKFFLSQNNSFKEEYLHGVDGLFTNERGVCIGITTADCVPLFFYDEELRVIGVAHAGWRGTCGKIAEQMLFLMEKEYGTLRQNVSVLIGPSISGEKYEVGDELFYEFEQKGFPVECLFRCKDGKLYLDLWEANRWLLLQNGIRQDKIDIAGICTYTQYQDFFSARRLGIESGRMLSGLMLR